MDPDDLAMHDDAGGGGHAAATAGVGGVGASHPLSVHVEDGNNTSSDGAHAAAASSSVSSSAGVAAASSAASAVAATPLPPPQPTPADLALQSRVAAYRASCLSILTQFQTHHLIPHSGKVVIFDSQLVVKFAFDGMVQHDLSCAPVWDSWKKKYVGLLSVSDFLDILMSTYVAEDKSMFDNLSNARICDWAAYKRQRGTSINRLLCISPEATLHEAVRQLLNYRVHRLCVVQLALADTVLRIITNHGILRFLRNNSPLDLTNSITIRQLGIGVYHNLLTLTYETPVIKALELLSAYKVSSIPIVDSQMKPVDVYTRADVRYLALDQTWTNLDMTIEEALSKHRRGRSLPLCTRDDSIHTVSGILVSSMRHSLICVYPDTGTIEGVVSLTDIFSFLLNTNAPAAESRIAALMKDYAQFEAQEAARMAAEAEAARAAGAAPSPTSISATLVADELLRQKRFLADHGQGDEEGMEDEASAIAAAAAAAAAASAAAEGAPLPHPSQYLDPAQYARSLGVAGLDSSGASSNSPQASQPAMLSPAIRPSPPDDRVPKDMDYLS